MAGNVLLKAPRFRRVGMEKPAWMEQCVGAGLTGLFYGPHNERPESRPWREKRAKRLCYRCPVQTACALYALTNGEKQGIWGGLTESERRVTLKAWNRARRTSQAG